MFSNASECRNVSEKFGGFCRRTVSPMHAIFNTVHAMLQINNIFQFQDIRRIFTGVRSCTDGQIDRQTDGQRNG